MINSALFAFLHFLAVFGIFATVFFEWQTMSRTQTLAEALRIQVCDRGFGIFAASMAVVAIAWFAATPLTLRRPRLIQRVGFALIGPAQRLFEHLDAAPGTYTENDVSPYFWHNGK